MAQKDLKSRIGSVKNIQKITRAMEMVAAARLRRAEQRIEHLRPYASAIRRMTRQAAAAAENIPSLPILQEHEQIRRVGLLFVTGDRGLAGAFNSQILRAGLRAANEHDDEGRTTVPYASGRRVADDLMSAYVDGELDQVEIFYNGYISPLTQEVRRETLLPLQHATILEAADQEADEDAGHRALVEYEPDPEQILHRLIPDYVEISVFRALLESTASEHGARMTAMRNASDNAGELIEGLTLQMNRARQAEITQEIMEVVAGAEALG
jgi:F-type H+-transporting ATPase subunit gamma